MNILIAVICFLGAAVAIGLAIKVAVDMAEKRINERMDAWHEAIQRINADDLDNAMLAMGYQRATEFYPMTDNGVKVTEMRDVWVKAEDKSDEKA
jgi:hypothetical protein